VNVDALLLHLGGPHAEKLGEERLTLRLTLRRVSHERLPVARNCEVLMPTTSLGRRAPVSLNRSVLTIAALVGLLLLVAQPTALIVEDAPGARILKSDDVVPAPSPSLAGNSSRFEDERGSYEQRCFGSGMCVNVLFTRKGFLRSGDLHRDRQVNHIVAGAVKLTQRIGKTDVTSSHRAAETVVLPAFTPHLYEFLEDTLMTEHWIDEGGKPAPFKAWLFKPYRDLISNDSLARRPPGASSSAQPHDRTAD